MKPHILVAGGGIGGLTAALALLRRGYTVDIYEQATELREVGAGVQISANGTRTLHELGVLQDLLKLAVETQGKEIRLWNTGQTWKLFDLGAESIKRYGFPYITVYRPDLHTVLANAVRAIRPDAIHLGCRVAGVDQQGGKVTLQMENGTSATGDALVGSDGVHSRIRKQLFGADNPHFTGVMAWRMTMPMDKLPGHMARNVGSNWVGAGGHVVHYPLHRGELMNFVGAIERDDWKVESWTTRGSVDECLGDFEGWHEDVQSMIKASPAHYKWALMVRDPMERWTEGHVTLLGDACHPMLPMLAQGAVMAIEDGYILGRAFDAYGSDIPTALAKYEAARRLRANKTVTGSAENAKRFHNPTLAHKEGAQAYVDREWSEERIAQRYEWLFTYDVTKVEV